MKELNTMNIKQLQRKQTSFLWKNKWCVLVATWLRFLQVKFQDHPVIMTESGLRLKDLRTQ